MDGVLEYIFFPHSHILSGPSVVNIHVLDEEINAIDKNVYSTIIQTVNIESQIFKNTF